MKTVVILIINCFNFESIILNASCSAEKALLRTTSPTMLIIGVTNEKILLNVAFNNHEHFNFKKVDDYTKERVGSMNSWDIDCRSLQFRISPLGCLLFEYIERSVLWDIYSAVQKFCLHGRLLWKCLTSENSFFVEND